MISRRNQGRGLWRRNTGKLDVDRSTAFCGRMLHLTMHTAMQEWDIGVAGSKKGMKWSVETWWHDSAQVTLNISIAKRAYRRQKDTRRLDFGYLTSDGTRVAEWKRNDKQGLSVVRVSPSTAGHSTASSWHIYNIDNEDKWAQLLMSKWKCST